MRVCGIPLSHQCRRAGATRLLLVARSGYRLDIRAIVCILVTIWPVGGRATTREFPFPAHVVRASADTARRLAEAARSRGDPHFAEMLAWRATDAEPRARFLDDLAGSQAAPGGLLELQFTVEHEVTVRAVEEG